MGQAWVCYLSAYPLAGCFRAIDHTGALRHNVANSVEKIGRHIGRSTVDQKRGFEMKRVALLPLCALVLGISVPAPVLAGPGVIERACRNSNRSAASPQLCGCIQNAANSSLTKREQRKVAKWFADPHRAQETRQSDRRGDEALWLRYKAFGESARKSCG